MPMFQKILVANRGEIAIRVLRAANEMGKATVAVFAEEDKLSLHRFKADEAYRIGSGLGPVRAYLAVEDVLRVACDTGADAIHPGYGFLSESPDLADACSEADVTFIGPPSGILRLLGDKVAARKVALDAGVPVLPATGALSDDADEALREAETIGWPALLKASWGGGGRGMRRVDSPDDFHDALAAARREAVAAFGRGEVFLERLVERAHHVEVQILADDSGTIVHLFERDCSVQRRNQKIVECAPSPYLDGESRKTLCDHALALARAVDYRNAGTVEFLYDIDRQEFCFIEVNPRVQVEHTVTEEVTGVDIVRAQIRIAEGAAIGESPDDACPPQDRLQLRGHAVQCRITTEDPLDRFIPDYGRITAYRGATGFGIRLDGGTAYSGAVITRHYDSLLEKVTARGATRKGAIDRMRRALREFRIRGVATNIAFLERLIDHDDFRAGRCTTRFIDTHPELLNFPRPQDRASRLLNHIAEVTVNGHPGVRGRPRPATRTGPPRPPVAEPRRPEAESRRADAETRYPETKPSRPDAETAPLAERPKTILDRDGAEAVATWMIAQKRVLVTDTTMRDAPQSLLATRMRSYDLLRVAESYEHSLAGLLSLECWGGATFDVAMRFLDECPWQRLRDLRERMPGHLLQMLLRASNAVGYTNYPDNLVEAFIHRAAEAGVDLFRVFDPLNWVDNMRLALSAVRSTGKICEAAVCFTGRLDDPERPKFGIDYYLRAAGSLAEAGAHVIAIKDMAGLLRPGDASVLVEAIRRETGLPVHLHTHDTSGISAASLLAAVDADVDAIDLAMDSLSGLTSQPPMGSVVEALRGQERDTGLDPATLRAFSDYWEDVRSQYAAFESDLRAPASEVYLHEMPGGQFTNLREQARSMGLADRWHEVAAAYAEVNRMFGDIVKVTPTSKVVGDMALAMVAGGLSRDQVEDPDREVAFPESVVGLFSGDLGQPEGGFPEQLSRKILKGETPSLDRPGERLPPADLDSLQEEAESSAGRPVTEEEMLSSALYPKVYADYMARDAKYGPVSVLPTDVYFYGLDPGREISVELERGHTLIIRCLAVSEVDEEGAARVFFELNGHPRRVRVDTPAALARERRPQADPDNPLHFASPMPGVVASLAVAAGQRVSRGDVLMTVEAMKMETTLSAERDGTIARLHVAAGEQVEAKDLLLEYAGE